MAPNSHAELWNRLNQVSDKITYMEPVLAALKEKADNLSARQDEFEHESRERWETHLENLHNMKSDFASQIHDLKSEQRVQMTRMGFYFGILSFLGLTVGGWIIKTGLDSVKASIVQTQTLKP